MTKELMAQWLIGFCAYLNMQHAPKTINISGIFGLALIDSGYRYLTESGSRPATELIFGGYTFMFIPQLRPNGIQYGDNPAISARTICHEVSRIMKYDPESEEREILEGFMLQLRGLGREVMQ